MDMTSTPAAGTRTARPWLRMFLGGLAMWLATVLVTFLTGNPNLVPTLVLLGSFLVPVTFVAWAFSGATRVSSPRAWCSTPSSKLLPVLEWGGLALISMVGIGWLVALWRRAPRPYRIGWQLPIRGYSYQGKPT